jgi:hypothetical protein
MNDLGEEAANLAKSTGAVAIKGLQTGVNIASNSLGAADQIVSSGLTAAVSATKAAVGVTEAAGTAAVGVTEHAGTAVVALSNTAGSIISIVRDLTVRTEAISKNAVLRQQDVEKLKNSELKKQVDVGIVNNTEETQKDILTIKTNAENAKLQIEREAENAKLQLIADAELQKREIEANDEQKKIKQQMEQQIKTDELQTNVRNYKECLAYGFKTDKAPYTIGSEEITSIIKMFRNPKKIQYFGYYIIIGVLHPQTLDLFEIHPKDFSEKQINDINRERKQSQLIYNDKNSNEVRVDLNKKFKKGFFSNVIETTPDVSVYDVNTNTEIITGIPVFLKKRYFLNTINGGKSRRRNKKHKKDSQKKRLAKKRLAKTIKK